MLELHQSIWNGRLGEIKATVHRIALKPKHAPHPPADINSGSEIPGYAGRSHPMKFDAGIIEPAQSEWASPIALAPKGDGTLRFCVEFLRLNNSTILDT